MVRLVGYNQSVQFTILWLFLRAKNIDFEAISSEENAQSLPYLLYHGEKITGFKTALKWIDQYWPIPKLIDQETWQNSKTLTLLPQLFQGTSSTLIETEHPLSQSLSLIETDFISKTDTNHSRNDLLIIAVWSYLHQINSSAMASILKNYPETSSWYHFKVTEGLFQSYTHWSFQQKQHIQKCC